MTTYIYLFSVGMTTEIATKRQIATSIVFCELPKIATGKIPYVQAYSRQITNQFFNASITVTIYRYQGFQCLLEQVQE